MKGTMENAAPNYEFGNPYACTLGRRASLVVQKFYFGYTDPMDDENKWTRLTVITASIDSFDTHSFWPSLGCDCFQMVTDKYFLHGLHRDILLRDSDPNFGPTYICRFSYVPQKIQSRAPYQHAQVDGKCRIVLFHTRKNVLCLQFQALFIMMIWNIFWKYQSNPSNRQRTIVTK